MSDLADLFPGYASEWINTKAGRIFARVGGKGPPLLLLHGFSETHVMWHRVAPQLADQFTLIIADLPGYGWSDMPRSDAEHTPYTKRAMAQAVIEAMEQLGHVHFALAGHDRGGRVSYRLALDHPGRLSRLAVLDILPTYDYWAKMDRLYALKIYHWAFLAQPHPLPGRRIRPVSPSIVTDRGPVYSANAANTAAAATQINSRSIDFPPSASRERPIRKNTAGTISIRGSGCDLGRSAIHPCHINRASTANTHGGVLTRMAMTICMSGSLDPRFHSGGCAAMISRR
jgi:pimeloyl-ACP methyl ester carboxylesterase